MLLFERSRTLTISAENPEEDKAKMPYATTDDGVRLYYEETGKGRPLILVHEFAGETDGGLQGDRHDGLPVCGCGTRSELLSPSRPDAAGGSSLSRHRQQREHRPGHNLQKVDTGFRDKCGTRLRGLDRDQGRRIG